MGMVGVPELKRRALGVLEKKMLKRQVRAQNQHRAVVEKGANKQKFFKVGRSCCLVLISADDK